MAERSTLRGGGCGRPRLIAAAMLAQLALAGCYSYAPVESGAVPVGRGVRVRVARGTDLSLAGVPLEANGGSSILGRLLRAPTADTLFCDVLLKAPTGGASRGLRSTLSIPMDAVEQVEIRSLDRVRTGGLVLVSSLLAWVIVDAAFDIRNGPEGPDDSGGGDNARVPLLRLSW